MPQPKEITEAKQLLVEGNDQRNFFEGFLTYIDCPGVTVQNFGGVKELHGFLRGLVRMQGFRSVKSIGIVRDAETDAGGAFQSVQAALNAAELPVPAHPGQQSGGRPRVSVHILPDADNPGMLETLLNRSFVDDPVNGCIDKFFQCVESLPDRQIRRPDKARSHAYIATQPEPYFSVGVAAKNDYWDLDHEAFAHLRSFLIEL